MNFFVEGETDRADKYLAVFLKVSRSTVQKYFKQGYVSQDGRRLKASSLISHGDTIFLDFPQMEDAQLIAHYPYIPIFYEDASIVVINKPAGVLSQRVEGSKEACVGTLLRKQGVHLAGGEDSGRPGLVHRLDRYTEGLMVLTKTEAAWSDLKEQFALHLVEKKYYAWVYGNFLKPFSTINKPIARHSRQRQRYVLSSKGRVAETHITRLIGYQTKTLLSLQPTTGRTHQLRVHLSSIGHSIIGDPVYAKKRGLGQLLQAYYLSFRSIGLKKNICFELGLSSRLYSRC